MMQLRLVVGKISIFWQVSKKEKKMENLVLIVVKGKYKVYRERKFPNGYSRQLVAIFKTSYAAEVFMNNYVI